MKNFRVLFFTIFYVSTMFVPLAFSGGNTNRYYVSPDLILNEVKIKGAKKVVSEIWTDYAEEEFVLRQIETGDFQWLEVAKTLISGSDAGSTTDIWFSVARALPKAPELVLKLIKESVPLNPYVSSFPLRQICIIPFIEAETEVKKEYLNKTEKALINVQESTLEDVRWECLRIIHYFQEKIYLDEEREKARQHLLKMEKGTN